MAESDSKLAKCNFVNQQFKCQAASRDLNGFCRRHMNWYKKRKQPLPIIDKFVTAPTLLETLQQLDSDTKALLRMWTQLPPKRQQDLAAELF